MFAMLVVAPVALMADPSADAGRDFKAATQRAAGGDIVGAIEQFEALGAARPMTRWTDDAWAETGRLAERAGDFARARRAYEQVIAVNDEISAAGSTGSATGSALRRDEVLVRRARAALARLAKATGDGRWDAVKREHDRLASRILGAPGDPREELAELERLARANPEYPRVAHAWLVVAQGWEREGEGGRALELLAAFTPKADDRERIGFAFARIAIRRGELAAARVRLDALEAVAGADRYAIGEIREKLEIAERRAWTRRIVWMLLAAIALLAAITIRRDAGSWNAAARSLVRPPIEVLFLFPVGAVLVVVSQTGNPLVARALLAIVVAGVLVAWVSGALLEARRKRGRVGAGRAVGQALIAAAAIAGATYLAVDRDRMLDLVAETIEHGPSH
jgi:tetratricopeptide (TPR) repeat protein